MIGKNLKKGFLSFSVNEVDDPHGCPTPIAGNEGIFRIFIDQKPHRCLLKPGWRGSKFICATLDYKRIAWHCYSVKLWYPSVEA